MSSEQPILTSDVSTPALIKGTTIVAVAFLVGMGVFYFLDLLTDVSLDVIKANRDKLFAFTEEHYISAVALFILT